MQLQDYVTQFSLEDILQIEQEDEQRQSLQNIRHVVQNKVDKNLFIYWVVQCALISFQIAWSGPKRREEVSQKIQKDYKNLIDFGYNNSQRWYNCMITSRYNKRLYNNKLKRLQKFEWFLHKEKLQKYSTNMQVLNKDIAHHMNQSINAKTITFTIKMYGYALRIVEQKIIYYPMHVKIPVDSRLTKIYQKQYPQKKKYTEQNIQDFFQKIAEKQNIPPLHLDALIRIKYRDEYM